MDDLDIIELYFARKEQAISETDRKYGSYCHQISMNILNNRQDAEECVSDTWLKAWYSIPPQRPGVLRLFLGTITRNISINRYQAQRTKRRHHDIELSLEELAECIPMKEEDAGELPNLLNGFLHGLSAEDRCLFVLRYWHAHSVKHLAETLGMSVGAVSNRLWRTREKLRIYLTERGYTV
ncbi:MAG: sigma-70 family RNA polymerase sigma factor [Ruminococcaceae bacterium]|nr:sigma-70 family RNA polymerase sigma factor [Oscillospiraceae bacterium]